MRFTLGHPKNRQAASAWVVAAFVCLGGLAQADPAWQLSWSDEFSLPDGSAPSGTNWTYNIGNGIGGWGNGELEYYTSRTNNARIEGGVLVLEAWREYYPAGTTNFAYTSARLKTEGCFSQAYGRFEARIKVPRGLGLWPAFWTLGTNHLTTPWPACGELDIMENLGREPHIVHLGAHGPGYSYTNSLTKSCSLPANRWFSLDYHVFAMEWETNRVRWLIDNTPYYTVSPYSLPSGTSWVFDHPFFIVLNLAVGGAWAGDPTLLPFPQRVQIDYVRVFTRIDAARPNLSLLQTNDTLQVSWPGTYPHANLERTATLGTTWTNYPVAAALSSGAFHAPVGPGFYRLRVTQ